jgi:hypothetical protein
VVTVDDAYWDSIAGDTNGAHDEDRDGCTIGHHDKPARNRSAGDSVTILPEKKICCPRVCDTEMCGRDLVWYSGICS